MDAFDISASGLSAQRARLDLITSNIANVDTPGFIRREVQFEEALAAAMQTARRAPQRASQVISSVNMRPREDHAAPARADGNNVDIDRELVSLAGNTLRFQAASELLAARVRTLRMAIQGNRR